MILYGNKSAIVRINQTKKIFNIEMKKKKLKINKKYKQVQPQ